jgi:Alw26I/Eco31I/Esp3I family type II restriction m6 adenine DNA methyltransferase
VLDNVLDGISGTNNLYAGKSLVERIAGRFYTPDILACDLAAKLADILESRAARDRLCPEIRACDPFCGDGRLVAALLVEATARPLLRGHRWLVTLRDVERAAAENAVRAVACAAASSGVEVTIRVVVGDSFAGASSDRFDVVVTNPPWELIKPDARELAHLSAKQQSDHKARLRALCDALDARFPEAHSDKAWGGWGTNLARCGWELALRSCAAGAALGIVLPSTILADQASEKMRRSAFRRSRLVDIAAYPSEARLFDRVDQPVVAATFVAEPADGINATLRLFASDRSVRASRRLVLGQAQMAEQGHSLPVGFGAETDDLSSRLSGLPRFSDLEGEAPTGLWAGRELDETRIEEKTQGGREYPFVKGRMVCRHGIAEIPNCSVRPELARKFRSAAFDRVAWRDVSRASQRRRLIGTIIPAGWVAGNSLHVAHFRDGDADRLSALHAVLSSFVLEHQVRTRLATGHISLGIVRAARIPVMDRTISAVLAAEVRRAIDKGGEAHASLEVAVARAYGLNRETLAAIIDQFPKLDYAEREAVLDKALWSRGSRR